MEEQFSQLGEEKYVYVSQGKRNMGKFKYASLRKTYNILSSRRNVPKYNYMFRIDTIKVVSLMQHMQEKLQLKSGRLHNDKNSKIFLYINSVAREYDFFK